MSQFAGQHKLVKYLTLSAEFKLPFTGHDEFGVTIPQESGDEIDFALDQSNDVLGLTMRQRLIRHVRVYNLTQEPRRRFFLVGLSSADMEFVASLIPAKSRTLYNGGNHDKTSSKAPLQDDRDVLMATDVCLGSPLGEGGDEDSVEIAVMKFVSE